jgi:hypothetical protein
MNKYAIILTILAMVCLAAPSMAQTWVEIPDAGDMPATAQYGDCDGPLSSITGALDAANGDYTDMYLITVVDPAAFSATTVGGTTLDTRLFLFDLNGFGITANDDSVGLQSTLTNVNMPAVGDQFYLAVSCFSNDAQDPGGLDMWDFSPFSEEVPPDGPGAAGPLAGWSNSNSCIGDYEIFLTGVSCSGVVAIEESSWGSLKSLYR